jgi:hypothetical protein
MKGDKYLCDGERLWSSTRQKLLDDESIGVYKIQSKESPFKTFYLDKFLQKLEVVFSSQQQELVHLSLSFKRLFEHFSDNPKEKFDLTEFPSSIRQPIRNEGIEILDFLSHLYPNFLKSVISTSERNETLKKYHKFRKKQ